MTVISYYQGTHRVGMLAWRWANGEPRQAIGGYAPSDAPGDDLTTVVVTDKAETTFPGHIHPDDIPEDLWE